MITQELYPIPCWKLEGLHEVMSRRYDFFSCLMSKTFGKLDPLSLAWLLGLKTKRVTLGFCYDAA
jgi:hypothetical protein